MTEAVAQEADTREITVAGAAINALLLLAAALALSTGLGLTEARSGGGLLSWLALKTPWSMPQRWHLALGAMLSSLIIMRLVFCWRCGRWTPVQQAARSPASTLGSVRLLLTVLLWGLLTMLIASGMLAWVYSDSPAVHGLMAWHQGMTWATLIAAAFYFLVVLVQQDWQRRPQLRIGQCRYREGVFALGAFFWSLAVFSMIERSLIPTLSVPRVINAPTLDGVADDAVWERAAPVILNAFNLDDGRSIPVRLRAVRDHQRVYFLFQWPDRNRSLRHMPLQKVSDGWVLTESRFRQGREAAYHEDGLAVVLSVDRFAGGSAALRGNLAVDGGQLRLPDSRDGELLADYWYWGSVRSQLHGQADDRALLADDQGDVLQVPDASDSGGVIRNFELWQGTRLVGVSRMPRDLEQLRLRLGVFKTDPLVSDVMPWISKLDETVPYHSLGDNLDEGVVIPSLIDLGPMTGSRGEVSAHGEWRDGWWTVELARTPDAGAGSDLPLQNDVHLSTVIFDQSQHRSFRHFQPVRLAFE